MQPNPTTAGIALDAASLLGTLRRGWLLSLAALVLSLAFALWYLRTTPKLYQSTVSIQVELKEHTQLNLDGLIQQDLSQAETLRTIEQSFKNRQLMQGALRSKRVQELRADEVVLRAADPEFIAFMTSRVTSTIRRGTRLIDISVAHEDPRLARELTQSLVEESVIANFRQHNARAKSTTEFLAVEADQLAQKAEASERALQEYKESVRSASLEGGHEIVLDRMKQIAADLTVVSVERLKIEASYGQMEAADGDLNSLLGIATISGDPGIVAIHRAYVEQSAEVSLLSGKYTEEHPTLIQTHSRLVETRRTLENALAKIVENFNSQKKAATAHEKSLQRALLEQEARALEISRSAIRYDALKRELEADIALHHAVVSRLKQSALAMDIQPSQFSVVEEASVPRLIRPIPRQIIPLFLLLGLAVGTGAAWIKGRFDTRLHTADEIGRMIDAPIVGQLLLPRPAQDKAWLLAPSAATGEIAEGFNAVATNLVILAGERPRFSILFTSSGAAEGQAFCSFNLAVTLARQSIRTLLVDADFRHPSLQEAFFPDADPAPGLSEFILGEVNLRSVVRPSSIPNLSCITTGRKLANPAEIVGRMALTRWLGEVAADFDRVIINGAPIGGVSDALIIARHVDAVCFVAAAGRTSSGAASYAVGQLRRVGANLAGAIITHGCKSGRSRSDFAVSQPASQERADKPHLVVPHLAK